MERTSGGCAREMMPREEATAEGRWEEQEEQEEQKEQEEQEEGEE
jgi:hypothetical protein